MLVSLIFGLAASLDPHLWNPEPVVRYSSLVALAHPCPSGWTGRWEYRQKAGDGYDEEGERLELSCRAGALSGLYHGLEREGEHGLFYTLTEIRDLKLSPDGEISFTVPGRALFYQPPATLQDVEQTRLASAGFTRDELLMKGRLQGNTLSLSCTSRAISCPEEVMMFRRAP